MAVPGDNLKLRDRDLGWNEVQAQLARLAREQLHVVVGVIGAPAAANHQGGKLTVGEIASFHEFGTRRLPQRSFIRAGIDEYKDAIQRRAVLVGQGITIGKFTAEQALSLLGEYTVGVLKQRIANGILPANAPSTIARKGSSKPLIDTGQLRNSITYRVERGA